MMDANKSVTAESIARERTLAPMSQANRREWWLWACAILVTALLAIGLASFALPMGDRLGPFFLDRGASGLLSLVCVFSLYIVYEQAKINRMRREFADALYQMAVFDPVTNIFN